MTVAISGGIMRAGSSSAGIITSGDARHGYSIDPVRVLVACRVRTVATFGCEIRAATALVGEHLDEQVVLDSEVCSGSS